MKQKNIKEPEIKKETLEEEIKKEVVVREHLLTAAEAKEMSLKAEALINIALGTIMHEASVGKTECVFEKQDIPAEAIKHLRHTLAELGYEVEPIISSGSSIKFIIKW